MENHNNLYRTMLFGLSILAGGQLGYATISADDTSSSQVTTSEVSSESSEQASQSIPETTAPVSQSTPTVSSSQVDEAEPSSSETESTEEQGGLSGRRATT